MIYRHPQEQPQEFFDKINELIQPLVDAFGINHFSYYRTTWTGRCYSFSSHKGWSDYYFANGLDCIAEGFPNFWNIGNMCRKQFIFFDDYEQDNPFGEQVVGAMRDKFDLYYPVSYYKACVGYTWAYTLCFPKENFGGGRRLLEDRKYFEEFLMYFREEAKDIFQAIRHQQYAPNYPKLHGYSEKKVNFADINDTSNAGFEAPTRFYVDEFDDTTYLTTREVECLRCLSKTTNYKKIASILQISQQTVQHHINSVRAKLGISNKTQLLELMNRGELLLGIVPDAVTDSIEKIEAARMNYGKQLKSLYMRGQQPRVGEALGITDIPARNLCKSITEDDYID